MFVGLAAEASAWGLVAFGRRNVWGVMTPVLVALGLAAILAGPPTWSPRIEPGTAVAVGVAVGVVLYLATRLFVFTVRGWGSFQRQSSGMYLRRGALSLPTILVLSVVLMVPGEELFWRGLFQVKLASSLGGRTALAALLTWGPSSWRTWRARTSRSSPGPSSEVRSGRSWGGGAVAPSRRSRATRSGRR